jgi:hypothetical protein
VGCLLVELERGLVLVAGKDADIASESAFAGYGAWMARHGDVADVKPRMPWKVWMCLSAAEDGVELGDVSKGGAEGVVPAIRCAGMCSPAADNDLCPGVAKLSKRWGAAGGLRNDGAVRVEQSKGEQMFGTQAAAVLLIGDRLDDQLSGPSWDLGEGAGGGKLSREPALRITSPQAVQEASALCGGERVGRPEALRVGRYRRLGVGVRLKDETPAVSVLEPGNEIGPIPGSLAPADLEACRGKQVSNPSGYGDLSAGRILARQRDQVAAELDYVDLCVNAVHVDQGEPPYDIRSAT